eukprot:gene20629-24779_t
MKRVVVTGMGAVTPFGNGVRHTWDQIIRSKSAVRSCVFDGAYSNLSSKVAARVPRLSDLTIGADSTIDRSILFDESVISSQYRSGCSDFIKYAVVAAQEAIGDSGIDLSTNNTLQERTGVIIGSGIGSMSDITMTHDAVAAGGINKSSAYFIPRILVNEASGIVSMIHNAKGPNISMVSACATGAHAIGESFRKIKYGEVDAMICGGTEASVVPLAMAGFARMKALSTKFNANPESASRPFDEARDGFVMGEGAGVLVLEELSHALARNAQIYAEVTGYGATGDAFHLSAPQADGEGAMRSMSLALKESNLESVDYINAHATSTPMGDVIECKAVAAMFPSLTSIAMSSSKGAIGHLLGAAGAVESIISIMALHTNTAPPTINLAKQSPSIDPRINLIANHPQSLSINSVLKNSFGFGGTNCSLVFKRFIR